LGAGWGGGGVVVGGFGGGPGGAAPRAAPDHWLAVLDADGAPVAARALLEAGRAVGLTLVGCEAVARLAAAARPALAVV
jgi:hypothetical protein